VFSVADHQFMARAFRLAEHGLNTTSPNPRVGCVIVRDNAIVGEGWHERAGQPHAEIHALKNAGNRTRGATAYVTLEPCNHAGRTGPCTTALIDAGIKRVVAAMIDPNPIVSGNGLRSLSGAGLEASFGLMENAAQALNRGFVTRMQRGRPWFTMKIAASLDGRTALNNGKSQWITGEDARRDGHVLRARSCGILTGIGSVKDDNPRLTVRAIDTSRQPRKILIDSKLKVSPDAAIFDGSPTLIFCAVDDIEKKSPLSDRNATIIALPDSHGKVDLAAMASELAAREFNDVLIEAGTKLNGSLLRAKLIDELIIYLAPHALGDGARGMFGIPELSDLAERFSFHFDDVRQIGPDIRITARTHV
jgi:diaminohydroxyphosphoribosylaminopyrimidine deaminase / 5-amino-6-(5-phosphoribosylamino)uracil reductase